MVLRYWYRKLQQAKHRTRCFAGLEQAFEHPARASPRVASKDSLLRLTLTGKEHVSCESEILPSNKGGSSKSWLQAKLDNLESSKESQVETSKRLKMGGSALAMTGSKGKWKSAEEADNAKRMMMPRASMKRHNLQLMIQERDLAAQVRG